MAGEVKEKKDMTKKVGSLNTDTPIKVPKTVWEKFSDQMNKPESEWSPTRDVERQMPNLMEWAEKSGAVDLVHNANAAATEAEFSSSMEEGTPYVAPEGAQLPESEIMPTTSVDESAGVAEDALDASDDEGANQLHNQVLNTPNEADIVTKPNVEDVKLPESTEPAPTSMATLFEMFNPNPERSEEEQETFEKNRRSSAIILSIADAINGLSNLGATVAGAPSREITSLTGKWAEVLNASEEKRQQKVDNWYSDRLKFTLKDYENAQAEAKAKAKEKRDNDEWDRRQGVQHKNQKELLAERDKMEKAKEERDNTEWTRREGIRHTNEVKEINARTKAAAENPKSTEDTHTEYFSANVNGTPVDVYLRDNEDYNRLYDILEKTMNEGGAEDKAALSDFEKKMREGTRDKDTTFAKKRDFVRANFAKYYGKIKNNPDFIHLSTQFRDNKGNVIVFNEKREAASAFDINSNIAATQEAIPKNNEKRGKGEKKVGVGMAGEGPLISSREKIQWYNE